MRMATRSNSTFSATCGMSMSMCMAAPFKLDLFGHLWQQLLRVECRELLTAHEDHIGRGAPLVESQPRREVLVVGEPPVHVPCADLERERSNG